MKSVLSLILAVSLSGCALTDSFVRKEVVVEYKYVVRKATDQQKTKPNPVPVIDVLKSNQLDLAKWIKDNEERQLRLESLLDELVKFYEQPVVEPSKSGE